MPETTVIDTRKLHEGARQVYIGERLTTLAPNLCGGWVAYCPKHDLGLRLATRTEARKQRATEAWCYGCISEKRERETTLNYGVDLSTLRYAASSECGCIRAWGEIRLQQEPTRKLPPSGLHDGSCATRCPFSDCRRPHWCGVCVAAGALTLVPRCAGCGAVPTWYHFKLLRTGTEKGGTTGRIYCSCGTEFDFENEVERHANRENGWRTTVSHSA